ncbi:MAG: DegT/DnrJ/EryC1/StrS family aminotransferase, partial [Syntrophales bacterium LBB04]|nr:DegT/DnrJ/EryC1/StrS family aminotransferase [Syntrophales bacterium LBB04]
PGHEVLVPAYNCGTEIDALIRSGARIVGYRVSRRCEIDLEDLMARRSEHTRAVYLIHYFGWEQPMEVLRRWCDEHGLLLIEDCALALFSTGSSGAIGRTGNAAIFSLPKTLGLCYGGFLSMPASWADRSPRLAPAGFGTLLKEIRHAARTDIYGSLESLGIFGALLSARDLLRGNRPEFNAGAEFPSMPDYYYFNPAMDEDRGLHPQTWTVAGLISCEETVRRRRANYMRLARSVDEIRGVEPLHKELPQGVCPLSLPLLVANRDACVKALEAKGIPALPWWAGFHRNGIDWSHFPDACWLKQNMLTLPIHQDLDPRHLEYIAETTEHVLRH